MTKTLIAALLVGLSLSACTGQGATNLDGSKVAGPLDSNDCTINPAFCNTLARNEIASK